MPRAGSSPGHSWHGQQPQPGRSRSRGQGACRRAAGRRRPSGGSSSKQGRLWRRSPRACACRVFTWGAWRTRVVSSPSATPPASEAGERGVLMPAPASTLLNSAPSLSRCAGGTCHKRTCPIQQCPLPSSTWQAGGGCRCRALPSALHVVPGSHCMRLCPSHVAIDVLCTTACCSYVLSRDLADHAVRKANLFQARPAQAPEWFK